MIQLRDAVTKYITLCRSLGYKLYDTELYLKDFIDYLEKNNSDYISVKLAVAWAILPQQAQPAHWSKRLGVIRGFAKYHSLNDSRTEIPSSLLLPYRAQGVNPHIYTDSEISRMLTACHSTSTQGLRHLTYYTLFGLLVVTGCRIGESIALDSADFNRGEGILTIRNSKFQKSRYVPLHSSSVQKLEEYLNARDQFHLNLKTESFFVSEKRA